MTIIKLIFLNLLYLFNHLYLFNLNHNKSFIEFGYCFAEILWGQFRLHLGTISTDPDLGNPRVKTRSLNIIDIQMVLNLGGHKYTFY